MAQIGNPWRAMALVSVFALAACEPGVDAVPLVDTTSPASPMVADGLAGGDLQSETVVSTFAENGLESLVIMTGPVDDEGIMGSGCSIDEAEPLPDGDWFGYVLDTSQRTLVVDIACVYGPDTDQFAAYSTTEESRWVNYVVVNDVVDERSVLFSTTAQAYLAAEDWQPRDLRDLVESSEMAPQAGARGVWLRVEDERVIAVVQPYTKGVASG